MGLFRIVILAFLFYLLYKVVFAGKTSEKLGRRRDGKQGGPDMAAANDVLVEDPVCHTFVPRRQAKSLQDGGNTYYFCSAECRETFIARNKEE